MALSAPEQRLLDEYGIVLPTSISKPGGNFLPFRRHGDVVYISGRIPEILTGSELIQDEAKASAKGLTAPADHTQFVCGKVGAEVSLELAQVAARLCCVSLLRNLKLACPGGDLGKIKAFLNVQGFVNGEPLFGDHPKVINGCSDMLCDLFGAEIGAHSRFAVGSGSLPRGVSVEVAAVVAVAES
ncbi:unnamed protein product [Amoebophrya sp. A120]|nr:unnamed protein product [Amoebophrya sp. A120]|eukprot:GSA120T00017552001.1